MRKIAFFGLMCWMAASLAAAEPQWMTSLPEALAIAKKENKLVLIDFTGSDWCSWCKKLDQDVFTKPEFIECAKKNLVLVQIDFPSRISQPAELKKANKALQSKYSVDGFPTLVLLKPASTVAWKQEGYPRDGLREVIAAINQAKKN